MNYQLESKREVLTSDKSRDSRLNHHSRSKGSAALTSFSFDDEKDYPASNPYPETFNSVGRTLANRVTEVRTCLELNEG